MLSWARQTHSLTAGLLRKKTLSLSFGPSRLPLSHSRPPVRLKSTARAQTQTEAKTETQQLAESLESYLQRQWRRLFEEMVKRRSFSFHTPWLRHHKAHTHTYSLSDLAGHGSFVFLALSYLENDFMHLRMYAASGITLSILFQYYRAIPLWIPIRWNSLFLLINAVMIGFLWKEREDAQHLPDEQRLLYKTIFHPRGMSPVEFMHLMSIAKRQEPRRGTLLVDEKKQNTRVFLVVKGRLSVNKKGNQVGTIQQNQFVGTMSFLTFQTKFTQSRQQKREAEESQAFWRLGVTPWNFDDDSGTSNPVKNTLSNLILWLRNKKKQEHEAEDVIEMNDSNNNNTTTSVVAASADEVNANTDNVTTTVSDSLAVAPLTAQESTLSAKSLEGQQGYADVICEEDCIVYTWKFKDLVHLVEEHPSLGLVVERCISDDLNHKMTSSWEEEIKTRYRQLLRGAVSDGEIGEQAKSVLDQFRTAYNISVKDHFQMLQELDWSREEFDLGFKDAPKLSVIQEYESMLKREISGPFGLSDDGRDALRQYRQKEGISGEIHLHSLRKLGWTLDDFEVGAKSSEVVKRRQYMSKEAQLSNITAAVTEALLEKNDVLLKKQAALAFEKEIARRAKLEKENARELQIRQEAAHLRKMFPVATWLVSWFVPPVSPEDAPSSDNKQAQKAAALQREAALLRHRPSVFMSDDESDVALRMIDKDFV